MSNVLSIRLDDLLFDKIKELEDQGLLFQKNSHSWCLTDLGVTVLKENNCVKSSLGVCK